VHRWTGATKCAGVSYNRVLTVCTADHQNLSWWTETDLRTDFFHQSDTPLGLTWCSLLLTCAHTAWKSTSASLLFCTSGQKRVENLKISRVQLVLYQEKRIKRQQTVSSARCKVLELIADLQKMAVAEWLQSFNSVRGPMESLGII